jgi:hypothetical protein
MMRFASGEPHVPLQRQRHPLDLRAAQPPAVTNEDIGKMLATAEKYGIEILAGSPAAERASGDDSARCRVMLRAGAHLVEKLQITFRHR